MSSSSWMADAGSRGLSSYRREPDPCTSPYALAAALCALLGPLTLGATAVIGFGLGIAALIDTTRADRLVRGWPMAISALLLSTCCLIGVPLGAGTYVPRRAQQRALAARQTCESRVRRIHHALLGHAARHGGRLPGTEAEFEQLIAGLPPEYRYCPLGGSYRLMPRWRGRRVDSLVERHPVPLIIEVEGDRRLYPHRGRGVVCLTDGKVLAQTPLEARSGNP